MNRAALGISGVLLLAGLWLGPLPGWAQESFTAHMTLHMGVVAVAAPILALALAGGERDPVRSAPWLFAAIPAAALELAVVWGWHAPALHHAARHTTAWFILEQASFLGVGWLVWMSALGGDRHDGGRAGSGLVALLLTSMHMTLLGALLALAPRPLFHAGASLGAALDDQQLGGAVMLLVGGTTYLAGGLWLSTRLLIAAREGRA